MKVRVSREEMIRISEDWGSDFPKWFRQLPPYTTIDAEIVEEDCLCSREDKCLRHTPSPVEKKCVTDGMVLTSMPPKYICKNCHEYWTVGETVPTCKTRLTANESKPHTTTGNSLKPIELFNPLYDFPFSAKEKINEIISHINRTHHPLEK